MAGFINSIPRNAADDIMAANNHPNFTSFFEGWLAKQEAFLQQLEALLLQSQSHVLDINLQCSEMIPRIFSQYQEFNRQKANAAAEDVFLLISPPWMSSFERSLQWISGFRPSIIFPIIERTVAEELSGEQKLRIAAVKAGTRRREKEITQSMARVQETVAEQPLYGYMRNFGKLVDGDNADFDDAMEELKAAMLVVVGEADALQGWTASQVVEILNPVQGVKLLAAVGRFQLQARKWGLERDSQREIY